MQALIIGHLLIHKTMTDSQFVQLSSGLNGLDMYVALMELVKVGAVVMQRIDEPSSPMERGKSLGGIYALSGLWYTHL